MWFHQQLNTLTNRRASIALPFILFYFIHIFRQPETYLALDLIKKITYNLPLNHWRAQVASYFLCKVSPYSFF